MDKFKCVRKVRAGVEVDVLRLRLDRYNLYSLKYKCRGKFVRELKFEPYLFDAVSLGESLRHF